jgi:hypothetical protein
MNVGLGGVSFRGYSGSGVRLAVRFLTLGVLILTAGFGRAQDMTSVHDGSLASSDGRSTILVDAARAEAAMEGVSTSAVDEVLPEEPRPQDQGDKPLVAAVPTTVPAKTSMPVAPLYSKYIPADMAAPQIHGREKLILGARDLYSLGNFGDMFVSAGWGQVWNGQPNYGTDRGAFGQRLGAAAIRETSEGILTDGVFSVMLHEDPRYFVLGPNFGFVHRTLYAVTRPLITRSSSDGHAMPNFALLLGYACAGALTNTYYPKSNRNFRDNISGYGESIGGSALGFAVDEFTSPLWKKLHLKKTP